LLSPATDEAGVAEPSRWPEASEMRGRAEAIHQMMNWAPLAGDQARVAKPTEVYGMLVPWPTTCV
jgi:hypothetical protein